MTNRATAIASRIDHTLLKPESTAAQIVQLCAEARTYRVAAVCVNPCRARLAVTELAGSGIPVCVVVGFPLGAIMSSSKADEVSSCRDLGATEFDMVMNLGALKDGDTAAVLDDLTAVREAAADLTLKVIIESATLTETEIGRASTLAVEAGADFVKTSTGFHPAGGATLDAVRLIRATIGSRAKVKASGGIHDLATAEAMIEAGADRLGISRTVAILQEL